MRRRLGRESAKTPTTTLRELNASVAQMGDMGVLTRSVFMALYQSKLYGSGKEKAAAEKS